MASRILTVCDAAVARINSVWGPASPDTVARAYRWKPSQRELNSLVGRHVRVFPASYGDELENRGEDRHRFGVSIIALERCADAGVPPDAWMDERLEWVQDKIADALDYDGRGGASAFLTAGSMKLLTETIEVATYDVEYQESLHLFWSEIEMTFFAIF